VRFLFFFPLKKPVVQALAQDLLDSDPVHGNPEVCDREFRMKEELNGRNSEGALLITNTSVRLSAELECW
jgi:hypothetical protein